MSQSVVGAREVVEMDVDDEIRAHTKEELAVLLAIGPKGCSWEKLRHKIRIVESLLRLLGCEFVDLSDETVWEILSSAKNRTLWVKKRGYCITTELGAKVYHRVLELVSERNRMASRVIDFLHGWSVSSLQTLADWLATAKSIEFMRAAEYPACENCEHRILINYKKENKQYYVCALSNCPFGYDLVGS
jgi:DNA-directed RNA polymerase subunit RPC12/RpoP